MSLLSRLFKSQSPAASSLDERIAALSDLNNDELLACSQSSDSDTIRAAAIALLPFSAALKALALGNAAANSINKNIANNATNKTNSVTNRINESLERAAQVRLGQLFEAGKVDMASLIDGAANTEQQLLLTQFSPKASLAVIAQIDDSQALFNLAVSAEVAKVRQTAANKIVDIDVLGQLVKSSKNKDKSVYKLVKGKLDQHKKQQLAAATLASSASVFCDTAEQLARAGGEQTEKLEQLQRRWKALSQQGDLCEAMQTRFDAALALYQRQLADKKAVAIAALTAKTDAIEAVASHRQALADETQAAIAEPLAQMHCLLLDIYNSDTFSADTVSGFETAIKLSCHQIDELPADAQQLDAALQFKQCHKDLLNTLQLCAEHGSLSELSAKLSTELNTELNKKPGSDDNKDKDTAARQLDKILRASKHLPNHLPSHLAQDELPEVITCARTALKQYKTAQQSYKKQQDSQRRQVSDLLRRGLHALEDSNLRRVAGISRDLEKLTPALAPLPAGMANKVEELAAGLAKLRDWHSFATEPKKQALLSKMEALIDSSLHPTDLASHVQRLQNEWKSLSKGSKNQDEELWQQFQTAANKAYEPCHQHFDEQAKVREGNLAKRQTLLEQLQGYIASNDLDGNNWHDEQCRSVEQLRQLAREEWRRYSPVARNENLKLQQTFEQHMDRISASIESYFHRGKSSKQQLIVQAEQLSQGDDNARSINGIKLLQTQWKNAGRCNRKDESALWSEFRGHCDAVFAVRTEDIKAQDIEQLANQTAAELVIVELEKLQALNGQDYLDAAHNITELNQQYYAIGNLPRACRSKISTQFKQLSDTLNSRIATERQYIKDQAWQAVFVASDAVRAFEWDKCDANQAQDTLDTAADNCPAAAKNSLQAIQQRFDTPAKDADAQQQNELKLQLLCLRAEILTGLETPAAHKAERMQYQIAQMSQGLGQVDKINANSQQQYTLEWLAIGAGLEANYTHLWQRFNVCLAALTNA